MNPLLLHPLFLELRRRRETFLSLEFICRPKGRIQNEFAGELKTWLHTAASVWRTDSGEGVFLAGRFTMDGGVRGHFTLATPESDCLGFELTNSAGEEGLLPLPEGNGLTYFPLWKEEHR